MFQPVGSQPPSVYWRRRLILLGGIALVIALIVLTVSTLAGGDGKPQAGRTPPPSTQPAAPSPTPDTSSSRTSSTPTPSRTGSSTPMPSTCPLGDLQLAARTGKSDYAVGDDVLVELQVINTGSAPCSRDLSDMQIELRVYNGTSRVWGSHDCATQPGTSVRTLAVGRPYFFEVQWGGLTSGSGCSPSERQRVGAGSYTLYASLAGKSATAAQFQIS